MWVLLGGRDGLMDNEKTPDIDREAMSAREGPWGQRVWRTRAGCAGL